VLGKPEHDLRSTSRRSIQVYFDSILALEHARINAAPCSEVDCDSLAEPAPNDFVDIGAGADEFHCTLSGEDIENVVKDFNEEEDDMIVGNCTIQAQEDDEEEQGQQAGQQLEQENNTTANGVPALEPPIIGTLANDEEEQ
jgi:hypothetical protein